MIVFRHISRFSSPRCLFCSTRSCSSKIAAKGTNKNEPTTDKPKDSQITKEDKEELPIESREEQVPDLPDLPPRPPPERFKVDAPKSLGVAGELWGRKAAPPEEVPDNAPWDERFFKTRSDTRYKDIIAAQSFMKDGEKDRETFLAKCEEFPKTITKHRHGQVEFIYGALALMKEYGVHKDLTAYKALMDVFPKEVMKPSNIFQAGFFHFFKQQDCAVTILDRMEREGVEPDIEMEKLVVDIFSRYSKPWRKVARQLYWFNKFKNANPFPIPEKIDDLSSLELAKIALKRMCPDLQTSLSVFSTTQIEDSIDKTWVVSAQSPSQRELIEEMAPGKVLYVEGSHHVWLKNIMITYFVLRADHHQVEDPEDEDPYDVSDIKINVFGKSPQSMVATQKDLHKTSDGVILALCATGTSSRDSLLSWIRLLEASNPKMKLLQTIFTLKAPTTDVEAINELNKDAPSKDDELDEEINS